MAGRYNPFQDGFLLGGAKEILALGSRAIKLWLDWRPDLAYRFDGPWPAPARLAELAADPRFGAVFDLPFATVVLEAFRADRPAGYWRTGFTAGDEAAEEEQFRELTIRLRCRPDGPGRTFVLQNWEGDWAVKGHEILDADAPVAAFDHMQRWLAARQRGVASGRASTPGSDVAVWHAAEVNLVARSMAGGRTVCTTILGELECDLYSYSSWDSALVPGGLPVALDYIAERCPPSPAFGERNVYVGEFGCPESDDPETAAARSRKLAEEAIAWGCPYLMFWELLDNAGTGTVQDIGRPGCGYWLIRPDGQPSPSRVVLAELLGTSADPGQRAEYTTGQSSPL